MKAKRIGRPPIPENQHRVPFTVSLARETIDRLEELAASRGISRSALIDALAIEEARRAARREARS